MSGIGGVSWSDYAGLAGGSGLVMGESSGQEVLDLNKALAGGGLAAGADINPPAVGAGVGFPLRLESLDATMFNVLYGASDVRFFRGLYKQAAYNTIEEFNQVIGYADGISAFIEEAALPETDDSTYRRNFTRIKYMGTTRRVSHVLALLKTHGGDVIARETVNGTLFLLRQLERTLFTGDSNLTSVKFDGLETLLALAFGDTRLYGDDYVSGYESDNVIDLRGKPLSEDHIADMTERLTAEPNYGNPSDLWLPTGQMKDLSKILYPKERYDLPAPKNGVAGINIQGVTTPFGTIRLNPDIFIPGSDLAPAAAVGDAAKRPSAFTISKEPTAEAYGGGDTTHWASDGSDDGVYEYRFVGVNAFGKTAAVDAGAAATFVAGSGHGEVEFILDQGATPPEHWEVYRTKPGEAQATARLIIRIKHVVGATFTIRDVNRFLPGTTKSYMCSFTSAVMKVLQLSPMTKIPLATVDTSIRWMQVLYLALQIMKPFHNGIYINVGPLETGAFAP